MAMTLTQDDLDAIIAAMNLDPPAVDVTLWKGEPVVTPTVAGAPVVTVPGDVGGLSGNAMQDVADALTIASQNDDSDADIGSVIKMCKGLSRWLGKAT